MSKNYPTVGFSDIADALGKIFDDRIVVNPEWQNWTVDKNPFINSKLESAVPHKLETQNGSIILEVIITGHNPSNVKVKWNDETHVLKIVDVVDEMEQETRSGKELPWYYTPLKLEFTLPEFTDKTTFEKCFSNGVLTVTAKYHEENPNKVMDVEI